MRRRRTQDSRWLSSVYLKTLRGYRVAIVGWGYGSALLVLSPMAGASAIVGTAAGRQTLLQIAASFSWNAAPVAIDTAAGYATFKIGVGILLMAIWALLAGSRTLRGEEESGALDVLLSAPRTRLRVAMAKAAAIGTALLGMAFVIGIVTFIGGSFFSAGYGFGDALLFGVNLALFCGVFAGVALLISQFTVERRRATGLTAAVLIVCIILDMVHRIWPGTEWVSQISPVYYFNLSKPLVTSYGTNVGGMAVLLALSLVLSGTAVCLFLRRDINGAVRLPRWLRLPRRARTRVSALPVRDWSPRSVFARSLRMVAMPAFWWTVAIAGFAAWMAVAVKQLEGTLAGLYSNPTIASVLGRLGGGNVRAGATLLSAIFSLLPVLLMAFVVTQVNRWAADEEDGRLELVLSTPRSRLTVLGGRFAALVTATCAISVVTLAATAIAASLAGLSLDGANLVAATLGMIPLALLIAAIGFLAAGWLRTAVDTGLVSILLALWFLISFVGPELQWPDAALRLSPFYYYGTPLLHSLQASVILGLLAAAALALAVGSLRFARKDIGR